MRLYCNPSLGSKNNIGRIRDNLHKRLKPKYFDTFFQLRHHFMHIASRNAPYGHIVLFFRYFVRGTSIRCLNIKFNSYCPCYVRNLNQFVGQVVFSIASVMLTLVNADPLGVRWLFPKLDLFLFSSTTNTLGAGCFTPSVVFHTELLSKSCPTGSEALFDVSIFLCSIFPRLCISFPPDYRIRRKQQSARHSQQLSKWKPNLLICHFFFPSGNNKYPTIRKKKTDVIYFLKRHEKTIQHWWYDFTWQIDCNCRVDERKEHRAFQKPLHLHFSPSATSFFGRVGQCGKAAVASGKFYFDQVVSSWEVTKQRCGSEGNWLYVGGKSSLLSMRCCCCEAASLLYYPRGALIGLHEWWKMTIYRDREIQVAESEKYIFHNNRNTQGNVASSNISLGPGGSGRVTRMGENDIMYKCKWQHFF